MNTGNPLKALMTVPNKHAGASRAYRKQWDAIDVVSSSLVNTHGMKRAFCRFARRGRACRQRARANPI